MYIFVFFFALEKIFFFARTATALEESLWMKTRRYEGTAKGWQNDNQIIRR
jgi:hypothetical protein